MFTIIPFLLKPKTKNWLDITERKMSEPDKIIIKLSARTKTRIIV